MKFSSLFAVVVLASAVPFASARLGAIQNTRRRTYEYNFQYPEQQTLYPILAGEGQECRGREQRVRADNGKGVHVSFAACAAACHGKSDFLIFGREGSNRCANAHRCQCYCETVTPWSTSHAELKAKDCNRRGHGGYDLYKFTSQATEPTPPPATPSPTPPPETHADSPTPPPTSESEAGPPAGEAAIVEKLLAGCDGGLEGACLQWSAGSWTCGRCAGSDNGVISDLQRDLAMKRAEVHKLEMDAERKSEQVNVEIKAVLRAVHDLQVVTRWT
jgi:hypothetical protein